MMNTFCQYDKLTVFDLGEAFYLSFIFAGKL
jgi:hypothetical protein